MLKKFIYFSVITLALESLCFADSQPLKDANGLYMQLMQGSKGILDAKGTPEQLRQMIDGCITAGITDRLYRNTQQPMLHINNLTPQKTLHVLLAYAFYALGFDDCTRIQQIKTHLGGHKSDIWSNFDREFTALCNLAFNKGTIFQYKNNLEEVIKRTSKGLKFDDFLEERFYEPGEISQIPQQCQALYTLLDRSHGPSTLSNALITMCPEFERKYTKKGTVQPAQLANSSPSPSPVSMTSQAPSPLIVATGGSADDAWFKDGYYARSEFLAKNGKETDFGSYKKMAISGVPFGALKIKFGLS